MSELINVTELTTTVTAMYRKHYRDFLKVLVWLLIPVIIGSIIPYLPLDKTIIFVIQAVLTIIIALISLWLSVVLIDMTAGFLGYKTHEMKGKLKKKGIYGRIIAFVIVSFIQSIIILLGGILFLIPGFIFAIWFSFARYAVLVDGYSPFKEAFKVSKKLTKGNFWAIFWRWVGSYVYYMIFIILGSSLILWIIGSLLGNSGLAFDTTAEWWSDIITSIVSVGITPIFIGIGIILYESAKKNKI